MVPPGPGFPLSSTVAGLRGRSRSVVEMLAVLAATQLTPGSEQAAICVFVWPMLLCNPTAVELPELESVPATTAAAPDGGSPRSMNGLQSPVGRLRSIRVIATDVMGLPPLALEICVEVMPASTELLMAIASPPRTLLFDPPPDVAPVVDVVDVVPAAVDVPPALVAGWPTATLPVLAPA